MNWIKLVYEKEEVVFIERFENYLVHFFNSKDIHDPSFNKQIYRDIIGPNIYNHNFRYDYDVDFILENEALFDSKKGYSETLREISDLINGMLRMNIYVHFIYVFWNIELKLFKYLFYHM